MKNILLVCAAGLSTSLLVNKMKEVAKNEGIDVNIQALPVAQCANALEKADIVLLGPQVRFQKPQIEEMAKGRIPVEVIDMKLYGTMNGKAILEATMEKIGK